MNSAIVIVTLLAVLFVAACGSTLVTPDAPAVAERGSEMPTSTPPSHEPSGESPETASYLEATVEPCSPVARSDRDPCDPSRFDDWESSTIDYQHPDAVDPPGVPVHGIVPKHPPRTTKEWARIHFEMALTHDPIEYPMDLPQIVVRGTFLPGTTRCVVHEYSISSTSTGNEVLIFSELRPDAIPDGTRCYMDFAAREYLVGKGPARFAVAPNSSIPYNVRNHELYKHEEFLSEVERRVEDRWKGAELILWLTAGHAGNAHVEVWNGGIVFTVQRESDGRLTVPSMPLIYHQDDLDTYRDRIFPELDDYRRDVKLAFQEVSEEFGVTLIEDANHEHLRAFMKSQGVHDVEEVDVVLPPPVPSD